MEQTVKIKDIGEYSIFVQKKMPIGTAAIGIRRKDNREWCISTEIIITEGGTVAYFNIRVDEIFKKGYTCQMTTLDSWEYELYLAELELVEGLKCLNLKYEHEKNI